MSAAYNRFITTSAALLIFVQAFTQLPGYKYFKLEKDNKQVKINTLYKNKQGYIFAGTDNGVYKFDGEKYISIHFENPDYNDTATAIFQDSRDRTWVGFKNGRIANLVNKKLVYFNPEEGTPKKKITAFLEDKEKNLWFSTNGEGIYCLKNGRLYLLNTDDGLSDGNVSSMVLTGNDEVLAGTDQGINICSFKNGKKKITVIGPRQGLPDYIVTSISTAGNNQYWIGLQDKGFCLYDHNNKTITIPTPAAAWNYGQVNSLLAAQGILWLATERNGLYKYSIERNSLDTVPQLIVGQTINDLVEDLQGNIWLSSATYSLVRTPGETLTLRPIPDPPVFEHVHAILCDKHGDIWLNDEMNVLRRISFKNGTVTEQKIHLPGINERIDITSLYQDSYENIWVGTMGKGLFIIDPYTLKHRSFTENSIFVDAGILSINGSQNTIYSSSLEGSMLVELSPENAAIDKGYHYTNYNNTNTGTNYIYSIFKDSRNRTWFATDGKGLTMLDQKIFTYYNNKDQIKDDRIYSVAEDKKGNIWFSTASAGIYKFDGKTFTNYAVKEGLSDLNISVLKTDKAGNIIIVHKQGLDILDPVTGNISYLNGNLGIPQVNAEDIGAVTKDTSGNIMVSTKNGILTYAFPVNSLQKPTALIESVQLFLKDLDDAATNSFSYDENNFTFNYTGLYYSDPGSVYYQYKLEGLDSSWVITKDRSKNFPKLEPGKYTFRIQASLNKNFQHADEASYAFVIEPAFYNTAWFIIICAFLLCALLYWYVRNRERALKKIERLRQEKIQFEFEVLRNQVNPHFLFNSFNTLISTIEEDPKIAVEYAEQLSEFFRNVVNQRDKDVVSLKDEIGSLYSYSFLQQKRYGNNLQVHIDITEEQQLANKIPPLTLQLLVENAIKHNALSKETPLFITLTVNEEDCLQVKNNMNPRINKQPGAGMGLQNIINRYLLLTKRAVLVKDDGKYFTVSLPLLK